MKRCGWVAGDRRNAKEAEAVPNKDIRYGPAAY